MLIGGNKYEELQLFSRLLYKSVKYHKMGLHGCDAKHITRGSLEISFTKSSALGCSRLGLALT